MTTYKIWTPRKVLILGSGGLKIGQAGEFDYSGSQAIKALKEVGIQTVLINPNIATIQTSTGMADSTYFLPVTPEFVEEVIKKEQPDSILLSFGGQTALNCGVMLKRQGILEKYNVQVLGTSVDAIEKTEDRDLFVKALNEIGALSPRSHATSNINEAKAAAQEIGFPVMIRVAFALGGSGSGICRTEEELVHRCEEAFSVSPQVLIEEWLGGWKEIEFEVVRDAFDNCITVCNMENLDPLGIHTGESIVVAPCQTLSDSELQKLRSISLQVIRHLGIVGECNIQYALDPLSEDYRIIEVNARLSRSSALASKATGYPLAFVAAKLALGLSLSEIENKLTRSTKSCFEPALDYLVLKVPRWDLKKFKNVDTHIGSEMKSVGEVMSIGRTFEELLQKALRMTASGAKGLACNNFTFKNLKDELQKPTDRRIFAVYEALRKNWSIERIYKYTKIDRWFLYRMQNILNIEREILAFEGPTLDRELMLKAKVNGFSDEQIALLRKTTESDIRYLRKTYGLKPVIKQIDSLAGEVAVKTNYLYMTYSGLTNDVQPSGRGVLVLGSGSYRIGSSVEFDWCCVNAVQTVRSLGRETIMLNCNPETVSTDYDTCDKLYFDELTLERTLDVLEYENPEGVILSMGGQIPNNMAMSLNRAGVPIFGTAAENIDRAEDRNKFSALLDELSIEQPQWTEVHSLEGARNFAADVGYPVLVRPSYVLSGAAMNVAWNDISLDNFLTAAAEVSPDHPVVLSKYLENAKEIEIDAVADKGEILMYAISEHVENAGVHSGDATVVLPAQRLYLQTVRTITKIAKQIAIALNITGPFNIQFLARRNIVQVIECNLRASRSFPFCSKVFKKNMIELAVLAMMGMSPGKVESSSVDVEYVGVKMAQFSYSRLKGADPVAGVEMASTGEVGCIGRGVRDAFMKAALSVGYRIPQKKVLLSTGPLEDKVDFISSARKLRDMGYELVASSGTARFLKNNEIDAQTLAWPLESKRPNIADLLRNHEVDLVINIPKNNRDTELKNDYLIRRMAVDYDIPLITNIKVAKQFIDSLEWYKAHGLEIKSWEEYRI